MEQEQNKEQYLINKIQFLRNLYESNTMLYSHLLNEIDQAERELKLYRSLSEGSRLQEESNRRNQEAYDERVEKNNNPRYDEIQELIRQHDNLITQANAERQKIDSKPREYWLTADGQVLYKRNINWIYDSERQLSDLENRIEQLYLVPREIYIDRQATEIYDPYGLLSQDEREKIQSLTFTTGLTSEEMKIQEDRIKEEERLKEEDRIRNLRAQRQNIYNFLRRDDILALQSLINKVESEMATEIFDDNGIELEEKEEQNLINQVTKFIESLNLSERQLEQFRHLTGREKAGLASKIIAGIQGINAGRTLLMKKPTFKVKSMFDKYIGDTQALLALGNIIYRARRQSEDGLNKDEIFLLIKDGIKSIVSAGKIVVAFQQAYGTAMAGTEGTLFSRFMDAYFKPSEIKPLPNPVKPAEPPTVMVDLNAERVSITSNMDAQEFLHRTPEEVLDLGFSNSRFELDRLNSQTDLKQVVESVTDFRLDSMPEIRPPRVPEGNIGAPNHIPGGMPDTGHVQTPSKPGAALGRVANGLSLASDIAWLADAAAKLDEVGNDFKPSQIMDVIGASLAVVGDVASFFGPVGELVGTIISSAGNFCASLGEIANLKSNPSTEEVLNAVGHFTESFSGPLVPSVDSIKQAVMYQRLRDNADNDIDKEVFDVYHKISALDCTPLINFFHCIYDDEMRRGERNRLIDKYGNFEGLMQRYIMDDTIFQNQLQGMHKFLMENSHTTHTQLLTAYLTKAQIQKLFESEDYYKDGYDIRSVKDNIQVREKQSNGEFRLVTKSGVSIFPAGANLKEDTNGREVLDTVSLGYGRGKESIQDDEGKVIANPRIIDTATQISYNNEQLKMFSDEFKHLHRVQYVRKVESGGCMSGVCNVGSELIYDYREDPKYARFRCWIDLVDDISGTTVQREYGTLTQEEVNQLPENLKMEYNYHHRPVIQNLQNVNNSVISTISDIIFPKIETKGGNDDVILTNVERIYNDIKGDSVVKAIADGGEGIDILDLTGIHEEGVEDFNFQYSIKDNHLSYNRQNINDGKNYDLNFYNFEQIRLNENTNNSITIKDGTDFILNGSDNLEQIGIIGLLSRKNNIDFSGVTGRNLYFAGGINSENIVIGTENSDKIVIQTVETKKEVKRIGFANINGGSGDDLIIGGNFKDQMGELHRGNSLHGGSGNDLIKGNGEYNLIYGDSGRDVIYGSDVEGTYNELHGGADNDTILSGKFGGELFGEEGNDILKGKEGNDKIYGGDGSDKIIGDSGNDELRGGEGSDYLRGSNGDDKIYGECGDDFLDGGDGKDTFYFGDNFGNDVITDYKNGDVIRFEGDLGGAGNDMYSVSFLKSVESDFLAIITKQGCIKIKGVDSADYLSIQFGDYYHTTNLEIQEKLSKSMTFEEYSTPFLPIEEQSQLAATSHVDTTLSYSTENQYTEVFSGTLVSGQAS